MRVGNRGKIAFPAGEVVEFAASELARYLGRITGGRFEAVEGAAGEARFRLSTSGELDGDEFRIAVRDDSCTIEGGSERACLYGVYELLERFLGCAFPLPGSERVPKNREAELPEGEWRFPPAFPVRGIVEDSKHVPEDDPDALSEHERALLLTLDWMAKRKLNRYFPGSRFPKAVVGRLLPEFRRRGIELEGGGHHLPQLLPRELFGGRPDLFRMNAEGRRVPDGNLCPSSEEALDIVAENVLYALSEGPEVALYHLWADDLPGGGWCGCPKCKGLSPSDQYLKVVGRVARRLRREGIEVPLDFLAYHDTLLPPKGEPEENVWLTFAPRERCYAHPLGDPGCRRNRRHLAALKGLLDKFPPGRAVAFEYYGDSFLWGSVGVVCVSTVCADLSLYKSLGLSGVQCLIFGPHSFWAYGPNLYAFSVAAWEGEVEPRSVLLDFCRALASPGRAEVWAEILARFERAVSPFLTYADVKLTEKPDPGCLPDPVGAMREGLGELRALLSQLPEPEGDWERAFGALLRFTASELEAVLAVNSFLLKGRDGEGLREALRALERGLAVLPGLPWAGLWGKIGFPRWQGAYIARVRKLAERGGPR